MIHVLQPLIVDTHRTSFSFSTTSLAEISVSAVQAADSVKSSEATIGDAVDDPVNVSSSIVICDQFEGASSCVVVQVAPAMKPALLKIQSRC